MSLTRQDPSLCPNLCSLSSTSSIAASGDGVGWGGGGRRRRKRRKVSIGKRKKGINRSVARGDLPERCIIKTLVTHISLEGTEFTVMSL